MGGERLSFEQGRVGIDATARRLTIAGEPAKLGSRAFDLLHALVERRDRVVPKQELLDVVWPGLVVEENNLQVQVTALRKLLGAHAIATVSGRGYRFTLDADAASGAAGPAPPAARDTLFGRDELLAQVLAELRDDGTRLLTLTGPGGSGKTRLGLRLAEEMTTVVADGTYVVLLAPVRDASHLMATVAVALGLQEGGAESLTTLVHGYLRRREVLLVLDNLEHLPEAAVQISELLRNCPRLKVLATSRAVLRLRDERVRMVPPLALPAADDSASVVASPAVALFAARAAAFGRNVLASAEDARCSAQICRRLDGLPLAIELAAARLRALSPAALAERLPQSLPLLKSSHGELPERQQTLRSTISWSHDLLDAPVQRLFRRLGVFAGGWSLDAAEALADDDADPLEALEALIEFNLVQRLDDVDGQPRFAMLETIREFALERLTAVDETETTRDRHARFFVALAAAGEPHLTSAARQPWLVRLRAEMNNFRLAMAHVVRERRDVAAALALSASLTWLWYFEGLLREGRGWMKEALALPGATELRREHTAVVAGEARLATFAGDMPEAYKALTAAIASWRALGDARGLALALFYLGVPAMLFAGRDAAVQTLREARAIFRSLDDTWGVALATTYEGIVLAFVPGTESEALATLKEGLARTVALGDEWAASTCTVYIGIVAMRNGDFRTARRHFLHGLETSRETGDRFRVARGTYILGELDLIEGRAAPALVCLAEMLELSHEQGRLGEWPQALRLVGRALALLGRYAEAATLLGAGSQTVAQRSTLHPDNAGAATAAAEACRQALGDAAFERAWDEGALMPIERAVDRAAAAARAAASP